MAPYAPDFLFDGPARAPRTIVLAHGAGAPMDSPFMALIAEGLASTGLRVARFEFPYMQATRADGKRRPPNGGKTLEAAWRTVIEALGANGLVIGGKSMGGRIASMVADDAGVAGLVCLGYPFHPPGRPSQTRTAHLAELRTPALIVQGERDAFGSLDDMVGYDLSPAVRVRWLPDGDHSFVPRKRSGRTEAENIDQALAWVSEFVRGL